jgi:hypothetical protein
LLPKLNFPDYEFRFKKNDKGGLMIFDTIRKKFVDLSPEEWVRQNLISYLIHQKHYPQSLFSVETVLALNKTQKRTDVIVYNTDKKISVLAECKAPSIKITKSVAEQALRYNLVHNAEYVVLTNGLVHVYYQIIAGKPQQIVDMIDYK